MAPREPLIESAVNLLSHPSVASSPLERRIEFLKSKNLTQEEIDLALARASTEPPSTSQPPPSTYYPPQQYRQPPPNYGYTYNQYGDWQALPPPVPKRDWRDWFIMATVVGGASYGLYVLTQRYIKPLIAPPTPPQLEQDKAAIDEQFNRAFALLDTLSADTTTLKEAEEARTQKLDSVISDVESVVAELKAANARREDESKKIELEIKSMKDSLPRAIDGVKQGNEKQLRELSQELGSLKALMSNRIGTSSNFAAGSPTPSSQPSYMSSRPPPDVGRSNATSPAPEVTPGSGSNLTGVNVSGTVPAYTNPYSSTPGASRPSTTPSTRPPQPTVPSFSSTSNKAAIPAWQMAAQNKAKDAQVNSAGAGKEIDSQQQPADGADAIAALSAS